MAIRYTITVDEKKLRRAFERLVKTGRNPRPVLMRIGMYVRREAQRELRTRPRSWGQRTNRLGQSLAIQAGANYVVVGSNLVYAAIQQLGGTVRPKTVRYLAIPVLPQLRRRGVWPRDLPQDSLRFVRRAEIRIGAHSWTGPALVRAEETELETTADGAGVVGANEKKRRRPRRKAGEVMFALVRQVKIRGRVYLKFDRPAQQFALQQLGQEYRRAIG